MLDTIQTGEGHEGKKFIYSNFRTLEGVEIFSRVLKVAGYELFNGKNKDHQPRYAIISGTESPEHRREILQHFNSKENLRGEYLEIILGTTSAAEGISLKHVRQIHIMEPWWNEVRVQQVVGRGRRIGSHLELPENERNVHVYRYLSVMTESQKNTIKDKREHETTDEHVYNKAQKKARINQQFITMLREISIDVVLNASHNQNIKYGVRQITIPSSLKYTYVPSIDNETLYTVEDNIIKVSFAAFEFKHPSLYEKDGLPKYVVKVDQDTKRYIKNYVYIKSDSTKLLHSAYPLYDRVIATASNDFILRGYMVDKLGLVGKASVDVVK